MIVIGSLRPTQHPVRRTDLLLERLFTPDFDTASGARCEAFQKLHLIG